MKEFLPAYLLRSPLLKPPTASIFRVGLGWSRWREEKRNEGRGGEKTQHPSSTHRHFQLPSCQGPDQDANRPIGVRFQPSQLHPPYFSLVASSFPKDPGEEKASGF